MSEELQEAPEEKAEEAPPAETPPEKAEAPAEQKTNGETIAAGVEEKSEEKPVEKEAPYWPEDWTEKAAEHYAAGDKKSYARELKRLGRIKDPAALYGMYREAEGRLTSGGLVKIPGKDASEEDVAAYHKALGVPEKAEGYFKDIKLDNGAVIGDADKPVVEYFANAAHEGGMPPGAFNKLINAYYAAEEDRAAALDDADDAFKTDSTKELKEELGPSYRRQTNGIGSLFKTAPGGTDAKNQKALFNRLLAGRMADGRIVGDDPDMIRWLVGMNGELNPASMVVEDGDQSGKSIATELAEIKKLRNTDPTLYDSKETQAREQELIAAQTKIQARA